MSSSTSIVGFNVKNTFASNNYNAEILARESKAILQDVTFKKAQLRQHIFELLSDPVSINNWSSLSVYESVRQVFAKPKQVEVCTKFVKVLGFLFFALRQTKLKFGQDFET